MMDTSVGAINSGSRKKISRPSQRNILKRQRYSDVDPNLYGFQRSCNHNTKAFRCNSVKRADIKKAREKFYEEPVKSVQDQKLGHLISVSEPKRKRPKHDVPAEKKKPKSLQATYFFRVKGKKSVLPVCRGLFLAAFGITKNRLTPILKAIQEGNIPKDKRGGDRYAKRSGPVKEKIRIFLKNLPASESHYNRRKSCRVYLSSDLNIATYLYKMYNSQNPAFVASLSMFKRVFYNEFNIGFSSPASDVCGTCLNLKNSIKKAEQAEKAALMTKLRIHKMRANAFYTLLKENPPNSYSFCFDLQQIHPLPKTPIQDSFYLRQISFYSFCCVGVKSKNPVFYTWTEDQASRGSTEIGSALLAHLRSLDLENIETLRLFCDGCGGQNKNAHIVHCLALWFRIEAPPSLNQVVLHFPVRGHSYLPADRVFGRVERILKKHSIIHNPEEYQEYYGKLGRVRILGKDWNLYDIKNLSTTYNKFPGIKDFKKIYLKKIVNQGQSTVQYKGSAFFNFDELKPYASMIKRGRSETNCNLSLLPLGNAISEEKKNNVKCLLEKQFNNENFQWQELPELNFYKKIFSDSTSHVTEEVPEEPNECDCMEEDHALHI